MFSNIVISPTDQSKEKRNMTRFNIYSYIFIYLSIFSVCAFVFVYVCATIVNEGQRRELELQLVGNTKSVVTVI